MNVLKKYRIKRYLFFWASILAYFLPFVVVTASLLPFMTASTGKKFAIGMALVLVNALPFIGGIFRSLFAHFPFINGLSILFLGLAFFFCADLFQSYVYTFISIEISAALGSIAACVLWALHLKFKRKCEQAQTYYELKKTEG